MAKIFGTTIEQLQNKSKNALDIFTRTLNELHAINEEAKTEIDKKTESITRLVDERNAMSDVIVKNREVISKIQNILS
jgi:predicted HAD superfamily Cof-like phosphohydrolase